MDKFRANHWLRASLLVVILAGLCGCAHPSLTSLIIGAPSADANGVKSYTVMSVFLGRHSTVVRVLEPNHPVAGKPHRFLYVLPVEVGVSTLRSNWSDGFEELRLLDVPNRFNITLVAPSFNLEPWYGDDALNPFRRLESFVINDLVPFGDSFAPPGTVPQRWVIGLSKSAFGALTLILRHPDAFNAVAAFDGPVEMTDMRFPRCKCQVAENFGTQENFNQYEIPNLVTRNAASFRTTNRIWISGDQAVWTTDMNRLHDQMLQAGIVHTWASGSVRVHSWNSGWLDGAVTSLDQSASSVPVNEKTIRWSRSMIAPWREEHSSAQSWAHPVQ